MEQVDYKEQIKHRIEEAVMSNYKASPAFTSAYNGLVTSLTIDINKVNKYVNDSVSKGISPEVAIECWVLTIINGI